MVTVPPAAPVTTPLLFTLAMLPLLVFQIPPDVASVNWIEDPAHTDELPFIAATVAAAFTVTVLVAKDVPQPAELSV